MNTQLQRMMVILFLVLTLIAVTILFWLPVNNDSDRILVAKEGPSGGLLNLVTQEEVSKEASLMEELAPAEPLNMEPGSDLLAQNKADLVTDDAELEYDPADHGKAEALEASDKMYTNGKNGVASSLVSVAAPTKVSSEPIAYAYDVMGNKRAHISNYNIRQSDWFSMITEKYWDDLFLWPDLYTMNMNNLRSANPDLIHPGEEVRIYESLTADGKFSEDDRRTLLSAYLKVYKMYKQMGESKNLAASQLLAAAVRYDKDFLEKYSSMIASKDKQVALRLIKEQKFLD